MNKAENQINDMEQKEAKNKQKSGQEEEKENPKKMRIIKAASWTSSRGPTFTF